MPPRRAPVAAALAHANDDHKQRVLDLLPELHKYRRNAIYTRDAYLEEKKALHRRLTGRSLCWFHLGYELWRWYGVVLVLCIGLAASIGIYPLVLSSLPSYVATVLRSEHMQPYIEAALKSLSPLVVLSAFAIFISKSHRLEQCVRMKARWDALHNEGNDVYERLRSAFRNGDRAAVQVDPAVEIQGLRAHYQSIYDLHDHTDNKAYQLADAKLDQAWLPEDRARSDLDFPALAAR